MNIRSRPALTSLLVNTALFTALLTGLALPPEARAESPSITILASDYAARAQTDYAGLYAHIARAAAAICRSLRPSVATRIVHRDRECVAEVVDQTVARVNDEALSAYHRQQAGTTSARLAAR
jgi:UrcA family protein